MQPSLKRMKRRHLDIEICKDAYSFRPLAHTFTPSVPTLATVACPSQAHLCRRKGRLRPRAVWDDSSLLRGLCCATKSEADEAQTSRYRDLQGCLQLSATSTHFYSIRPNPGYCSMSFTSTFMQKKRPSQTAGSLGYTSLHICSCLKVKLNTTLTPVVVVRAPHEPEPHSSGTAPEIGGIVPKSALQVRLCRS